MAAAMLVLATVGLGGSVADAATELRLAPATGPPGTGFTVTGSGFAAADVEIHWDSQTGPLLATAAGPDFSVDAVVPDSPPNSHTVVAVVRTDGRVSTSSAAFQVTPGAEPVVTTTTTTVVDPATTTPSVPAAADPAPTTPAPPPTLPAGATDASARAEVDAAVAKALAESNASVSAALASVDVAVAAAATATTAPGPGPGGAGTGAAPGAPTPSTLPGAAGAAGTLPAPGVTPGSAATSAPEGEALAPRPTARKSAGADPRVLLLVALALIVGAALVLVVRNRERFSPQGAGDDPASDAPPNPPGGVGHNQRP